LALGNLISVSRKKFAPNAANTWIAYANIVVEALDNSNKSLNSQLFMLLPEVSQAVGTKAV
jgi:hypothetical protein